MHRLSELSKRLQQMPRLLAFVLGNAAIGAALGVAFALLLLAIDAAGLRTLIAGSSEPVAPVVLLLLGFATLIGALYTAAAIMLVPPGEDDDDPTVD